MDIEARREEAKRLVAQGLFDAGFGEDPLRNWYMACMLVAHKDFKSLCEFSENFQHGELQYALNSHEQVVLFLRRTEALIHELSFGLSVPSIEITVNQRVAEYFLGMLNIVLPWLP